MVYFAQSSRKTQMVSAADKKPGFIVPYITQDSEISRPVSDHDLINEQHLKTADR